MNVWIQRHDFEADDIEDPSIESALIQFQQMDWAEEARLASEKADEETCPAGMGFVHPSDNILHLCPDGSDEMQVHYHCGVEKRVLGLFRKTHQEMLSFDSVSVAHVEALVRFHYANDSHSILQLMKRCA